VAEYVLPSTAESLAKLRLIGLYTPAFKYLNVALSFSVVKVGLSAVSDAMFLWISTSSYTFSQPVKALSIRTVSLSESSKSALRPDGSLNSGLIDCVPQQGVAMPEDVSTESHGHIKP
jgi:hypothetical protein